MRRRGFQTKDYRTKRGGVNEFVFEGYGAVFGQEDRQGDVIEPGAFQKTLEASGGQFPLITDHELGDLRKRLGVAYAEADDEGVRVEGHINTETTVGADVASTIEFSEKHGLPIGLSFGYEVERKGYDADIGGRRLKELTVYEWSLTQMQSQPGATVTDTKKCRGCGCELAGKAHGSGNLARAFDRLEQLLKAA
jgi:HK97 family phage prohead protease